MESIGSVVIGAGVVGLAIGRALSASGEEVFVLEKNERVGEETSSRNSEVIHAGIYYPTNSLKARLCVTGKEQLYAYAESKGIEHSRIGKFIVAIDAEQISRLQAIGAQAAKNGVLDLEWTGKERLAQIEPNVRAEAALWSPSTGIIDVHGLMLSLHGDIEQAGSAVLPRSHVKAATRVPGGIELTVDSEGQESTIVTRTVVNAAGLHAPTVAALLGDTGQTGMPDQRFARGNYFLYSGKSPFDHLIYPIPVVGGLGIHATLDLRGALRFGPDVEWIDELDYTVDESRIESFYSAIREYWPDIPDGSLRSGYAGIRPKLSGPGEPAADFAFVHVGSPADGQVVHLFGIESPGLTSCLAIADHVAALLEQ